MGSLSCPACARDVSLTPAVGAIAICPRCLASVVIDGEVVRRAVAADTTVLTEDELRKLRGVRKQFRGAA